MSSYFSRAVGLTALVLSSMALQACVDEPSPMESAAEACEATPTGCEPVPEARVIAGVITVTNTGGGMEVGSLRWAVAQAMPDDTIRFDPSLAGQTITVEATVKADRPMVIEGPADKGVVISGGLQHRVFDLTHPGTTVIRNLTITQGKPNDFGPGGGIMSTGTLVLEHTTVHDNEADVGAGVYATNLTLRNSTISGNTSNFAPTKYPAVVGAGRHVYENSTITGNSPAGIGGINGLTLRNSIVADNGTLNCTYPSGIVFEGTNLSNDDTCGGPSVIIIADPKL